MQQTINAETNASQAEALRQKAAGLEAHAAELEEHCRKKFGKTPEPAAKNALEMEAQIEQIYGDLSQEGLEAHIESELKHYHHCIADLTQLRQYCRNKFGKAPEVPTFEPPAV
jgi:hypothetical protein